MRKVTFPQILKALDRLKLPPYKLVVGIGEGGTVAASLVAYKLGCNLRIVHFNYRNEKNLPQHLKPILLSRASLPKNIKSILLVDDVSRSGKTLQAAKRLFKDYTVKTMVFIGRADYVLFPQINSCVRWPWKV